MNAIFAMLVLLIGLVPDETAKTNLHPPPNGDVSLASWTNFWCAGDFWRHVKEIPLTNSALVTLVDDEDYELLAENRWQINKDSGVQRTSRFRGRLFNVMMHRVIMNAPDGVEVDHRNRNPLDNWKDNLRLSTHAENTRNASKAGGKSSRFKGVSWYKAGELWTAYIRANGRQLHLGRFLREEDAALAYNEAASQYFGEFACLNPL